VKQRFIRFPITFCEAVRHEPLQGCVLIWIL
jgi:hypothetical protein